jgi:hypothetical protein
VAWQRGAAELGGKHGVATLVEAWPPRIEGWAPAMAASSTLARLRWACAGLARLPRDIRLRVVPGRLLGIVAALASCQMTAAAGTPLSSPSPWIGGLRWDSGQPSYSVAAFLARFSSAVSPKATPCSV